MKINKPQFTQLQWAGFIIVIALLFGLFIRFFPTGQTSFPPNDGGMFLSMIQDLTHSKYILPEYTSYNLLQIPYAYPPFGFYTARIISDIFQVSELNILRFLPPFVNSISILVFYFLASEILKSKTLGALSSAFYALTPGAFGWFVMGGGLTRSFGSLFLLLTVISIYKLYQNGNKKYMVWGSVWGGLAVLSHPEAGLHTAFACILLWIFFGRTSQSLIKSVFVGIGVLVFSSPWWLTVILYHGLTPFLSAIHTGSYGTSLWLAFYHLMIGEGVLPILIIFRLIGIVWVVWKREYFLLAWVIVPYLVEPRSAPSISFYPMTMLIALAFAEVFPFLVYKFRKQKIDSQNLYENKFYNISLFVLLIYLFIECNLYGFRLIGNTLKLTEIQAMNWIQENISRDAKFISITGIPSPEIDPFIEWFPALAERRNQSTIQGYEWVLGEKFFERYVDLAELQKCQTVTCVESWSIKTDLDFQYLVVIKKNENENLLQSLGDMNAYTQLYDSSEVVIYER